MTSAVPPVDPTGVLADLGADSSRLAVLSSAASERAGLIPGRVSRSERVGADVLTPDGPILAATTETVCTGDWVIVDRGGDPPRIVTVLDRQTALIRRAADSDTPQVLATNMDEVWIVIPLDRPIATERAERALVLAWESGAAPVLIATKADLATPDELGDAMSSLASAGPGTPVLVVSATTGLGVPSLQERLGRGRTTALLGASGAGKSSLINALAGGDVVDVGTVRASDSKGRHTTAWRELVLAAGGGVMIDSPGLRAVGMWIDDGGIDAAFSDVAELTAQCRFNDCAHETEPGCAVTAAIAAGDLDPRRLESYRKLRREAAWAEHRNDARAAAAERRVWAARSRDARERARHRDR